MSLAMNTVTVYEVDAYKFEEFVAEHGGESFSFQADEECADDTDHKYEIDGEVDEWDQEKVDNTLSGGYDSYVTRSLLNYFAKQGLIPTGSYLIRLY